MFSVCPHLGGGGVPICHNALQDYPEFHGADTWGGGVSYQVKLGGGTLPGPAGGYPAWGVPCWGYPDRVPPARSGRWGTQVGYPPARSGQGGTLQGVPYLGTPQPQARSGRWRGRGYPVRTTEGVLTTWRAVCLLRSRRRTFLFGIFSM